MPCLGSRDAGMTETTYLTCWQAVDILGHDARDQSRDSEQEGLHVGDEFATGLMNTKIKLVILEQVYVLSHFKKIAVERRRLVTGKSSTGIYRQPPYLRHRVLIIRTSRQL